MWFNTIDMMIKRILIWIILSKFIETHEISSNEQFNSYEYVPLKCEYDLNTGNQICDCQHRNQVKLWHAYNNILCCCCCHCSIDNRCND